MLAEGPASAKFLGRFWAASQEGSALTYPISMAGVLVALCSDLFILLRNQDFALASGSIGLFIALSSSMYLTRNIKWGEVGSDSD